MNKTLITLISLFSFVCFAQSKNNIPKEYELMKNAKDINLSFDYSTVKVKKVNIKNFVELKLNMPFERFTSNVESVFIEAANEELDKQGMKFIGKDESSDIEIKITFLDADPDGEHNISIIVFHKPSSTVISSFEENSNGGDGDSFVEQFVTGLQKTGEKVGKRINKIKKSVNSEE